MNNIDGPFRQICSPFDINLFHVNRAILRLQTTSVASSVEKKEE